MASVDNDTDDPPGVAERAASQEDVFTAESRFLVLSVIGAFEAIDLVVRLLA